MKYCYFPAFGVGQLPTEMGSVSHEFYMHYMKNESYVMQFWLQSLRHKEFALLFRPNYGNGKALLK